MVLTIHTNNHKSIPYLSIDGMRIGTFQVTLMYFLINFMYCRVNDDLKTKNLIHSTISNLYAMRNTYLGDKKTILDNTPFREFITTCMGETNTLQRERQIEIDRKRKTKEMISFNYNPTEESSKQLVEKSMLKFSNTSGNLIINEKNRLLFNNKSEDEEIIEDVDSSSQ